jgi:hypothetical protein
MPVQKKSLIGKTAASNKTTSTSAEGSSLKASGVTALSMAKKRYIQAYKRKFIVGKKKA